MRVIQQRRAAADTKVSVALLHCQPGKGSQQIKSAGHCRRNTQPLPLQQKVHAKKQQHTGNGNTGQRPGQIYNRCAQCAKLFHQPQHTAGGAGHHHRTLPGQLIAHPVGAPQAIGGAGPGAHHGDGRLLVKQRQRPLAVQQHRRVENVPQPGGIGSILHGQQENIAPGAVRQDAVRPGEALVRKQLGLSRRQPLGQGQLLGVGIVYVLRGAIALQQQKPAAVAEPRQGRQPYPVFQRRHGSPLLPFTASFPTAAPPPRWPRSATRSGGTWESARFCRTGPAPPGSGPAPRSRWLVSAGGSAEEWGSASYIGRFTYDYDNKYLFQYSANYNGSLSYSPDKRWGYFQAFSLGWVMSDEVWFKNLVNPNIVNMIKLRGGFGLVGNEVGSPFSFLTQYAQSSNRILFGENMASNVGWYESDVANNLQWSSSKQYGIGLDFGFLKDRLTGSFDTFLYLNKGDVMDMTDDMIRVDILGMPNTPKINAPYTTSRKGGFEVSLNWQDKIGKVGYRVGVNYSYWDERVTRHSSSDSDWWTPTFDNIGKRPYVTNGESITYPYGLKTNGLHGSWQNMYNSLLHANNNMTLGTPALVDLNGDGRVNDYYVFNAEGSTPHTQFGVTLGADWNGFDLELFFQGATGARGAMPSPLRSQQSYMWNYGQYAFQNAYTPSNPDVDAALPTPVPEGNGFGYSYIDIWSFDASYLKLKNISLRYDLKRSVLKNLPVIQGLDLSFVVTNAFTWTKKSYPLKDLQDPEFITTGASIYNNNGTLGSYPTQRSYTLGVTVTL